MMTSINQVPGNYSTVINYLVQLKLEVRLLARSLNPIPGGDPARRSMGSFTVLYGWGSVPKGRRRPLASFISPAAVSRISHRKPDVDH